MKFLKTQFVNLVLTGSHDFMPFQLTQMPNTVVGALSFWQCVCFYLIKLRGGMFGLRESIWGASDILITAIFR